MYQKLELPWPILKHIHKGVGSECKKSEQAGMLGKDAYLDAGGFATVYYASHAET